MPKYFDFRPGSTLLFKEILTTDRYTLYYVFTYDEDNVLVDVSHDVASICADFDPVLGCVRVMCLQPRDMVRHISQCLLNDPFALKCNHVYERFVPDEE